MNERRTSPAETQPLMTSPFNDPTRNKKDARQRIALSGWQVWALLGVLSLIAVAALMWFLLPAKEWKTLRVENAAPGSQIDGRNQGIPTEDGKVLLPYRKSLGGLVPTGQKADSAYGPTVIVKANLPPAPPSETLVPPPGMVYVKGGEFMMGRNDSEDAFEKPAHLVPVKSFFIDKTEVTNEEYQNFLDANSNRPAPTGWQDRRFPPGQEKYPVTGVTWKDAREYAISVGKRLSTEAEWEYAARGTDGRLYPWGNDWVAENANVATGRLAPVGQYGADKSPFGVFDMAGNAVEWTEDTAKPYQEGQVPKDILDLLRSSRNPKIIRGGHYKDTSKPIYATVTNRGIYPATAQDWSNSKNADYSHVGFRCAKDAPR